MLTLAEVQNGLSQPGTGDYSACFRSYITTPDHDRGTKGKLSAIADFCPDSLIWPSFGVETAPIEDAGPVLIAVPASLGIWNWVLQVHLRVFPMFTEGNVPDGRINASREDLNK